MFAQTAEEQIISARVAALDIGISVFARCVRVPADGNAGKRLQEVSTHSTMTRSLTELANHLVELGVERVVMEATSGLLETGGAPRGRSRSSGGERPTPLVSRSGR